jgi:hypothetical protein
LDRPKKPAFRLLAALLVGLAVVGLDFVSRQIYKKFRKPPVRPVAEHREPSPFYHHGLRPNASVMDTFGDRQYPFFSNSLGMRDGSVREVSLDKKGPRILLIGDSFTEGVGLPWEKTFAGILATRLSAEGVEVLNSGVNSYCPVLFKGRLKFLFEQKGLEVDRVVALVDISDIMQELTYRETPEGKIVAQPLFPGNDGEIVSVYVRREEWIRNNLEDQFVILGALARNLRLWHRDHRSPPAVRRQDEIGTWAFHWPEYRGPYEKLIQKGLQLAQQHMTEVAADLRQRGIALTVVIYPWPQQLPNLSRPSRAETVWAEWAEKNRVDFINLFRDFARLGSPDEIRRDYYLRNDWHWNARGNALVAGLLLDSYGALILPPPRGPQKTAGSAP